MWLVMLDAFQTSMAVLVGDSRHICCVACFCRLV